MNVALFASKTHFITLMLVLDMCHVQLTAVTKVLRFTAGGRHQLRKSCFKCCACVQVIPREKRLEPIAYWIRSMGEEVAHEAQPLTPCCR